MLWAIYLGKYRFLDNTQELVLRALILKAEYHNLNFSLWFVFQGFYLRKWHVSFLYFNRVSLFRFQYNCYVWAVRMVQLRGFCGNGWPAHFWFGLRTSLYRNRLWAWKSANQSKKRKIRGSLVQRLCRNPVENQQSKGVAHKKLLKSWIWIPWCKLNGGLRLSWIPL